ncbi:hypothetical protein ZIOFF_034493 [Zingiber officinale]|uniref:NAC domain-containing protein n=1 Tax=Zingiber officinale TaxID=94328 RepID=A0A8J5GPM4_ZINOF|nr:hypothetical protein ZIOFF_034493 [Zingiber officinale]
MQSTDSAFDAAVKPPLPPLPSIPPPHPRLPPGFRFHPTNEELVLHYLKKKAASAPLPVAIITEVDLYKFDPWELPGYPVPFLVSNFHSHSLDLLGQPLTIAITVTGKTSFGEQECQVKVGVKKGLVFYRGKPPKGVKTNWIMHEYRLVDDHYCHRSSGPPHVANKKGADRSG